MSDKGQYGRNHPVNPNTHSQNRGNIRPSAVSDETRRYMGDEFREELRSRSSRSQPEQADWNTGYAQGNPYGYDSVNDYGATADYGYDSDYTDAQYWDDYDTEWENEQYQDSYSGQNYRDRYDYERSEQAWYQNAGQQGYSGYTEAYRRPAGPSMAQRATGKASVDPYRNGQRNSKKRTRQTSSRYAAQQTTPQRENYRAQAYEEERRQPKRRRRKKRHPFRTLFLFLLLLCAVVLGGYFLLFRAPEQATVAGFDRKNDFYNIMVCATDEDGTRTDTIMMLTLDQANRKVSLTSIPRDTLLESGDKLNSVYAYAGCGAAGAEALMERLRDMLGFQADGYMIISYDAFKDTVDALGGVTFDVPETMTVDYANNPEDVKTIYAGEQVLDGDSALRVCRYRDYLMGDIQRIYVQQSFIKCMIKQCLMPRNIWRLPAVYAAIERNLQTDLSGSNVRFIGLWAMLSYQNGITQNTLPGDGVYYYGSSCIALYGQSVVEMVNAVMNPYHQEITLEESNVYTVYTDWDGYDYIAKSDASGVAFDAASYFTYEENDTEPEENWYEETADTWQETTDEYDYE